jgi:RNA polymerase sigma-70 factor (ECF subfamily)
MSREEERDLLERCRAGESTAYEPIVRAYEGRLYGFFYRLTGDVDEARDLTQDTFIRAYRRIHLYSPDRPLVPWLLSIARNLHVDRLRSRNGRENDRVWTSRPLDILPDPGPAPDRAAIEGEIREMLWNALNTLGPLHREILILKDIEDLDYREIAAILNIPPGTVASRLHNARVALRDSLNARTRDHDRDLPVCA